MILLPIQVAKASFSQTSSHQAIVTRSPNHWCAISCAQTPAYCRRKRIVSSAGFDEDGRRDVGDEARVLHRPEPDGLGNDEMVELLVRVRDVEVVLEQVEDRSRGLHRPARVGAAPLRDDDPDRHLVPAGRARGHDVERADRERDQVARQRLGPREDHLLHPAGLVRLGLDRRVGDGDETLRHVQRELPRDLEARLVEARERPPREDRLELAEHVPVVSFPLSEEALRVLEVEAAFVGKRHGIFARRKISLKVNTDEVRARGRRLRRDGVFRSIRRRAPTPTRP